MKRFEKPTTRRVAALGISAALALVLSYVEFLLPPLYPILPAVKCGLANIAVTFVLYRFGKSYAAALAGVKVLLSALLFGSAVSLVYSAAGACLSLAVMIVMMLPKQKSGEGFFSPIGVSVGGGVAHNVGQIAAACVMMRTAELAAYLPVLLISGTLAGALVGIAAAIAIKRVKI